MLKGVVAVKWRCVRLTMKYRLADWCQRIFYPISCNMYNSFHQSLSTCCPHFLYLAWGNNSSDAVSSQGRSVTFLSPFIEGVMQCLNRSISGITRREADNGWYLGQRDVWDNDCVQGAGSIPGSLASVAFGVVLIFEMLGVVFMFVLNFPGHRAVCNRNFGF